MVLARRSTCFCSLFKTILSHNTLRPFTTAAVLNTDLSEEAKWKLLQQAPKVKGSTLPLMTSRKLQYPNPFMRPRQAWLESMEKIGDQKLGIVDLHPDIFATFPRLDILHNNIQWQLRYRQIEYRRVRTRGEMIGSRRKLYKQKTAGKARHGDKYAPIFVGGGHAKGPRGPMSKFYMIPRSKRVLGLRTALSVKYAQDDLYIVKDLTLPNVKNHAKYLDEFITQQGWGLSVLFVDHTDELPIDFLEAIEPYKYYNAMPVYSLNVYSILKHDKLVLTLKAVEKIEERLLHWLHKSGKI